jgi:hypothetical protein
MVDRFITWQMSPHYVQDCCRAAAACKITLWCLSMPAAAHQVTSLSHSTYHYALLERNIYMPACFSCLAGSVHCPQAAHSSTASSCAGSCQNHAAHHQPHAIRAAHTAAQVKLDRWAPCTLQAVLLVQLPASFIKAADAWRAVIIITAAAAHATCSMMKTAAQQHAL